MQCQIYFEDNLNHYKLNEWYFGTLLNSWLNLNDLLWIVVEIMLKCNKMYLRRETIEYNHILIQVVLEKYLE